MAKLPDINEWAKEAGEATFAEFKRLITEEYGISFERLAELVVAEHAGCNVTTPCKIGQTMYVITTCKKVQMNHDNDYIDGTGDVQCPYEGECPCENCGEEDDVKRIFECEVTDFWYGEQNGMVVDMLLDKLNMSITAHDIGRTAFKSREEAEAALEKEASS